MKCENVPSQLKIFNSNGAEVPLEFLEEIIRKYEKMENFYLRIELGNTGEADLPGHVVTIANVSMFSNCAQNIYTCIYIRHYLYNDTLQELRAVLISQSLKHLLEKGTDMDKKDRSRVIRSTADAMTDKHGNKPSKTTLKNYASALNYLFPIWNLVHTTYIYKSIYLYIRSS